MMTDYYQHKFQQYHEETFSIDSSVFLDPFLNRIKKGALVLDVGCGSGRDLCLLKKRGFRAIGFERSTGLADIAKAKSGCRVIMGDFEKYEFSTLSVHALLLVTSLVHIHYDRFPEILNRILKAVKFQGLIFISVKEGGHEKTDAEGRVFFPWRDLKLRPIFEKIGMEIVEKSESISSKKSDDIILSYVLKKV